MDVSNYLKKERLRKKLSVKEVSEKSGFSIKTIYAWEKGDKNITFKNFEKILFSLGKEVQIKDRKNECEYFE